MTLTSDHFNRPPVKQGNTDWNPVSVTEPRHRRLNHCGLYTTWCPTLLMAHVIFKHRCCFENCSLFFYFIFFFSLSFPKTVNFLWTSEKWAWHNKHFLLGLVTESWGRVFLVVQERWVSVRSLTGKQWCVKFHAIVRVNAGDCHVQEDATGDGQHNYCVCFSDAYNTPYSSPLK